MSNIQSAPRFPGYEQVIHEATGYTDRTILAEIEDLMRNIIFHSTLDWQTRAQLKKAAREADEIRILMNARDVTPQQQRIA